MYCGYTAQGELKCYPPSQHISSNPTKHNPEEIRQHKHGATFRNIIAETFTDSLKTIPISNVWNDQIYLVNKADAVYLSKGTEIILYLNGTVRLTCKITSERAAITQDGDPAVTTTIVTFQVLRVQQMDDNNKNNTFNMMVVNGPIPIPIPSPSPSPIPSPSPSPSTNTNTNTNTNITLQITATEYIKNPVSKTNVRLTFRLHAATCSGWAYVLIPYGNTTLDHYVDGGQIAYVQDVSNVFESSLFSIVNGEKQYNDFLQNTAAVNLKYPETKVSGTPPAYLCFRIGIDSISYLDISSTSLLSAFYALSTIENVCMVSCKQSRLINASVTYVKVDKCKPLSIDGTTCANN